MRITAHNVFDNVFEITQDSILFNSSSSAPSILSLESALTSLGRSWNSSFSLRRSRCSLIIFMTYTRHSKAWSFIHCGAWRTLFVSGFVWYWSVRQSRAPVSSPKSGFVWQVMYMPPFIFVRQGALFLTAWVKYPLAISTSPDQGSWCHTPTRLWKVARSFSRSSLLQTSSPCWSLPRYIPGWSREGRSLKKTFQSHLSLNKIKNNVNERVMYSTLKLQVSNKKSPSSVVEKNIVSRSKFIHLFSQKTKSK